MNDVALVHWGLLRYGKGSYIDLFKVQCCMYVPSVVNLKNSTFCLQGMRVDGFR